MGPDDSTERTQCLRCSRVRPVWELVDLTAADRAQLPADVPDHLCGACRGAMERSGKMDRAQMVRALGAPAKAIEKAEQAVNRRRGGSG